MNFRWTASLLSSDNCCCALRAASQKGLSSRFTDRPKAPFATAYCCVESAETLYYHKTASVSEVLQQCKHWHYCTKPHLHGHSVVGCVVPGPLSVVSNLELLLLVRRSLIFSGGFPADLLRAVRFECLKPVCFLQSDSAAPRYPALDW